MEKIHRRQVHILGVPIIQINSVTVNIDNSVIKVKPVFLNVIYKIAICNLIDYIKGMIKSFKHKGLKNFFEKGSKAGIQAHHADKLNLILSVLNAAISAQDMNLPAFRLHSLTGNRADIYSVWVSGNWRVTFRFVDGDAEIVNYEDYH